MKEEEKTQWRHTSLSPASLYWEDFSYSEEKSYLESCKSDRPEETQFHLLLTQGCFKTIPQQPSLQIMHFTAQALHGLVYAAFALGQGHLPHI